MGAAHITAALVAKGNLNMERFRVAGMMKTFPSGGFVTDSAAGGTALATGKKTYNGAISLSKRGERLKTSFEYAEEKGMATGLVVTCSVTHATPAVFVSHASHRGDYDTIADQIAISGIDILFGGGRGYFVPRGEEGSIRETEGDPIKKLGSRMELVDSREELDNVEHCSDIAFLYAWKHPEKSVSRGLPLADLTAKAIEHLSCREGGFILMVEGSQIDWGGHDEDLDYIISETVDFDDAVGVGLDFAEKDRGTLVIVTADHETGGLALHEGSVEGQEVSEAGFTTDDHTAEMVPIFSFGPGSSSFGGIHDNSYVGKKIIEYVKGRPEKPGRGGAPR